MTILCGTDFTPAAAEAVRVASGWARATREELLLVHALAPGSAELQTKLAEQLTAEASALIAAGVPSRCALETGTIHEQIIALAQRSRAALVVLGALGRRAGSGWKLGSTADLVARGVRAPLIVVREPAPLERWLAGSAPLKVAVAYEISPTADAALAWAAGLARLAPIELVLVHAYSLEDERRKRGLKGPLPIGGADARLEEPLRREIGAHVAGLKLGVAATLVARGGLGRPADQLVEMAAELGAGLVAVGNHHRAGVERAWKGSVSRGVIELARMSVACVSEHG